MRSRLGRPQASDPQHTAGQGPPVRHRRRPGDARSVRTAAGDPCRIHASGRALTFIDNLIRNEVLPR